MNRKPPPGTVAPLCAVCGQDVLHGDRAGWAACQRCQDWAVEQLATVGRLWAELPAYLAPAAHRGGERVTSGPAGSRPPLSLDVLSLLGPGGVHDRLSAHAAAWRAARGFAPRTIGAGGGGSTGAARGGVLQFLGAHLPWACEHLAAVADLAVDLADLTGRMRSATGSSGEAEADPTQPLDLPCPVAAGGVPCGGELRYDPRTRTVTCQACGAPLPTIAWLALGAA